MPYCKAGFQHLTLEDCDHVVKTQFNMSRPTFSLPEDYYSPQAVAARKAENRKRYQPVRRSFVREILIGNEADDRIF